MYYTIQSSIHRIFSHQQVCRKSNKGEHRHPQAGRTDFRPADWQGKAYIAGEKKKATDNSDITADTATGFWEQKAIAH